MSECLLEQMVGSVQSLGRELEKRATGVQVREWSNEEKSRNVLIDPVDQWCEVIVVRQGVTKLSLKTDTGREEMGHHK